MTDHPRDRSEFVIRFVFAGVFFGCVVALIGIRFVDSIGLLTLAVWSAITTALSLFAAIRGDEAWRTLANFFRWW